MSAREHLRPEGLPNPPTYSQVVVASGKRTIYVAGQIAVDANGALVGANDLGAQTTQVFHNIGLALAAAGATHADIVKITTFVVNYKPEHRAIIAEARAAFFTKGQPPASTLLGVTALAAPEWLIEVEAIAVVD